MKYHVAFSYVSKTLNSVDHIIQVDNGLLSNV